MERGYRAVVDMELWEAALLAIGAVLIAEVVRIVVSTAGAAPGQAPAGKRLGRLASLVAQLAGLGLTWMLAGFALLLVPFVLLAALLGAALGGSSESVNEIVLALLLVATAAVAGSVFLVPRLHRRITGAAARPEGSPLTPEVALGFAIVALLVVGGFAITVGREPGWTSVEVACEAAPPGEAGPPQRAREAAPVPLGLLGDLVMGLAEVTPVQLPGVPQGALRWHPTADGGATVGYEAGTHLRGTAVARLARDAIEAGGASVVDDWQEDPWTDRTRALAWSVGATHGRIAVQTCDGRTADRAHSVVVIGPEQLGACAPVQRRSACRSIYQAVHATIGRPGRDGPPAIGDDAAPLASVVAIGDRLSLTQGDVAMAFSRTDSDAADQVRRRLTRLGWKEVPKVDDGFLDLVDEELHFTLEQGEIQLVLRAVVRFASASVAVTTKPA